MNISNYATGLQHIGIPTNDIEKTKEFFMGIGFEEVLHTVNELAGEKVSFLRLGNLTIETYENHQALMENGAVDHICINVKDIESVFQVIKRGNYEMLDQEINFLPFWENGVRFFTILGPNHEKIEFAQII